jgi:HEPN domain-containing protein
MEKKIVLENLFDTFVASIQAKKRSVVSSLLYQNFDSYQTSNFEAIIGHMFFHSVRAYDELDPNEQNYLPSNEITDWYLYKAIKINTFEPNSSHCPKKLKQEQNTESEDSEEGSLSDHSNSTEFECGQVECELFLTPPLPSILSANEMHLLHQKKVKQKKLNKNQVHLQFLQSQDDLECALCLKMNDFFSQSVHASQQAAEKALKSVLKAKCIPASSWKSEHSLKKLYCTLGLFNEKLNYLCFDLEFLGIESWKNTHKKKISTLAIRARYCDSDNASFLYVDTFPSVVFDKNMALKAYISSKKIVSWCKTLIRREFANDADLH